jgi:hypothetical protein
MKRATALAVALGTSFWAQTARAACPPSVRPVVELFLEVEPPDRIIATTLETHLRSELGAREIDVCEAPAAPRVPIARVRLRVDHPQAGPVVATIQIGDEVTDKRVERVLKLSKLPADSRATAVAAATDELLRASWAELVVDGAPEPLIPPPPAVTRAVAASIRVSPAAASRAVRWELGVLGEASSYPGHREALGARVLGALWFHPRVAGTGQVGASWGLSRSSANGSAWIDSMMLGVGGAFGLVPKDKWIGARLEASLNVLRAAMAAAANVGVRSSSTTDWTASGQLGARGWIDTGALRWMLGMAASMPLRPLRAADNGVTVTSIEGVGVEATAGVSFTF